LAHEERDRQDRGLSNGTDAKLMPKQQIVRKALLTAVLEPPRMTQRVEIKEIDFEPGQETGMHTHPCPVVGFIVKGTATLQIDGGAMQHLAVGEAFYEPANKTILRFDNGSADKPMSFVAFYLLQENEHELIVML
jgi:quercetin dioxygenase-like cupin family protein